jgi:mRNA interferase RelE/StbE
MTLEDARRIRDALRNLVNNPRPPGCVKLAGFAAVWRIRAGRFRIIYEVYDDERRLMVLRIARRNETTYRRL